MRLHLHETHTSRRTLREPPQSAEPRGKVPSRANAKTLQGHLYEIAQKAQTECLLRDINTCTKAMLEGVDIFGSVLQMPEFHRVSM
jgi:hypothetical protein